MCKKFKYFNFFLVSVKQTINVSKGHDPVTGCLNGHISHGQTNAMVKAHCHFKAWAKKIA